MHGNHYPGTLQNSPTNVQLVEGIRFIGIDQFNRNVINNVIADLKNSSESAMGGNLSGMGGFGSGMGGIGMNGLGGGFNDEIGGGSAYGGMEEDQWNRFCE